MELLKDTDFRKECKSAPRVGYLLFGEEDYLKSYAVQTAREICSPDPAFSFFNEMRLDALEFTPSKLLDALMPMPMMSEKKLVIVNGLNFNTMRPNELDDLCDVLSELNSYDYNLLLFNVSSDCLDAGFLPKRPSSVLLRLSEYLTPVYFERCSTSKLAAWVQKHFLHNDIQAPPAFCSQMIEYCGHSMYILASEIDKLSFYLLSHGQTEPTADALERVCTPANEYDAFAFTNAIMDGHPDVALGILAAYRFRRIDPLFILGDVTRVISEMVAVRAMTDDSVAVSDISAALKLHEYKVGLYQKSLRKITDARLRRALDACTDADTSFKLSPVKGYSVLERLICVL